MKDADSILRDALDLPLDERERLALMLLESLGHERPPGVVSADELAARLNERVADVKAGHSALLDAKDALAKGRANLRRRPRT